MVQAILLTSSGPASQVSSASGIEGERRGMLNFFQKSAELC